MPLIESEVGDRSGSSQILSPKKKPHIKQETEEEAGGSTEHRWSPITADLGTKAEVPEPDDYSHFNGGLITEKMKAEQDALTKEAVAEEQKLLLKAKKEAKKRSAEEEERAQRERLRVLRHLLGKSKFYSEYIHSAVEKNKAEEKAKAAVENKKSHKKHKKGKRNLLMEQLVKDKELLDAEDAGSSNAPDQAKVATIQPKLFVGGTMRDYQIEGLEWLTGLYMNGVNGILADEMGLGKTIQVIALVCYLIEKGFQGPYLVVGPLSTLANWVSEFRRFAPMLEVILYHGPMEDRKKLWGSFKTPKFLPEGGEDGVLPVVITSYEVAMKDLVPLQIMKWEMLIIDEGHRIKNFQCKLVMELKKYRAKNRLLLTGTPLQNNLAELWSLLNFLLPDIFADLGIFESWFDVEDFSSMEGNLAETSKKLVQLEERDQTLSMLHKILHPFMLRRVKADVELGLPPKKELLVFTPMTAIQDEMYRAILNKTIHDLLKPEETEAIEVTEEDENGVAKKRKRRACTMTTKYYNFDHMKSNEFEELYNASIYSDVSANQERTQQGLQDVCRAQGFLSSLNPCSPFMDMRKLVNHPYLLRFPVYPGTNTLRVDEELVTCSGKMLVLDAMLAKLKQQGHKVLIFSQFTMMLDIIEEYLLMRCYRYCRLDGSRSILNRMENINLFNTDPDVTVFLLSTRAGGLGINLTGADTVIIYDSDWNPQCDLQAQDRCHRIGQTRPVVVYRLTTDGTVDRRMVERATGKRRLEKIVIKKGRFHGNKNKGRLGEEGTGLSPQELLELLNSKDYVKSIQSNGFIFTDSELEMLLDRSDLLGTKGDKMDSCDLFEVVESTPAN